MTNPEFVDPDRRHTYMGKASQLPYVVAVTIMMGLGVAAVVAVTLVRPEVDNSGMIASIFGFLAPTTLSLLAFMKSQETHLSVNSRLDAFLSSAKQVAHAQGVSEGVSEGRAMANQRTDELTVAKATATALLQAVGVTRPAAHRPEGSAIPEVEAPVTVVAPRKE